MARTDPIPPGLTDVRRRLRPFLVKLTVFLTKQLGEQYDAWDPSHNPDHSYVVIRPESEQGRGHAAISLRFEIAPAYKAPDKVRLHRYVYAQGCKLFVQSSDPVKPTACLCPRFWITPELVHGMVLARAHSIEPAAAAVRDKLDALIDELDTVRAALHAVRGSWSTSPDAATIALAQEAAHRAAYVKPSADVLTEAVREVHRLGKFYQERADRGEAA